jgi:inhibitor of cysteine peptidase
MAYITLKETNEGGTFLSSVGDFVIVLLEENPTTGYRWVESGVPKFLYLERDDFDHSLEGVGSSGIRKMRFRIIGSGAGVLTLKMYRSWEGEEAAIKKFAITINAGV